MRTEGWCILAALALHVGVVLVARGMPPLALLTDADQRELRVIDIDLTPTAAAVELPEQPQPTNLEPPTPEVERAGISRGAVPSGVPQGVPNPEATAEPNANPAPGSTPKSSFDTLPPGEDPRGVLGLQGVPGLGSPVWGMPGVLQAPGAAPPAPTVAPAPRQVDRDIAGQVLRDALSSRDKDMGIDLPAGGTISSAVSNAVRSSEVPNNSRGTIVCTIGPSGSLLDCKVLSMTSGTSDQWNRAAQAAQAALAGVALGLTGAYAKGAIVTLNVTSSDSPPAGSKGGFTGTGASFDVSNIGAHNTRKVRAAYSVRAVQ